MNNKNIRYITLLSGFVMTLLWGLDEQGLELFFFGGSEGYPFRFDLDDDLMIVVLFFTPYILAKMWQSYKSES